mgnify:CR=1 FL=1
MSFFSKISELFYDLFVTEPEEEEYIDSAGEDGKEAGPRMAGALPARAVRPLDAVIFVPRAYSDARRAVDAMEKGLVVLVVLGSNVDDETASRFVDFMSGAVYLGKGEVELLNGQVLLCAPSAVHIEMEQHAPPCGDSFVERSGRMKKIMMIGCGAMGGAILSGCLSKGLWTKEEVYIKASTEKVDGGKGRAIMAYLQLL